MERSTEASAGRLRVNRSIMRSLLANGTYLVDDNAGGVVDGSERLMNQLGETLSASRPNPSEKTAELTPTPARPRFCIMCGKHAEAVRCGSCGFDRGSAGPLAIEPFLPEPPAWKAATDSAWDEEEEYIERDEEPLAGTFPGFPRI